MPKSKLLKGTLDMLILRTLTGGSMHGYAVALRIREVTEDTLQIEEGSLYPALHRMERRGWVRSRWGASEKNRRAKYYSLTESGRLALQKEKKGWALVCEAIGQVLEKA